MQRGPGVVFLWVVYIMPVASHQQGRRRWPGQPVEEAGYAVLPHHLIRLERGVVVLPYSRIHVPDDVLSQTQARCAFGSQVAGREDDAEEARRGVALVPMDPHFGPAECDGVFKALVSKGVYVGLRHGHVDLQRRFGRAGAAGRNHIG